MTNFPEFLKAGDKVFLTCPASFVSSELKDAIQLLESWGLLVSIGQTVGHRFHQFSGNDELRTEDLQGALDDPEVKAIFAARGGYGTVRIIDNLDFSAFLHHPKWIVGFSDITVLHSHIQAQFCIPTIHGQMPVSVPDASADSLNTLRKLLFGEAHQYAYHHPSLTAWNRSGEAQGKIVGGNLAILHSLMGSDSDMDFTDKILFIEDVGEHYYQIDRMLWTLKRAGKLERLAGLIVGGFTNLKDNTEVPFGQSIEEIVLEKVKHLSFPVAFGFPAGHLSDNQALVFGKQAKLIVQQAQVDLKYLEENDYDWVSAQLEKPEGETGVLISQRMNESNRQMTETTIDLLQCKAGNKILEIGPGNGRFAGYVLNKAPEIHYSGLDISSTMIEESTKINAAHILSGKADFQLSDGVHIPYPNDHFDLVFTVNTVYFWKKPAIMLQEIKRSLKSNGKICIAFGSKTFMQNLPFVNHKFTLYTPQQLEHLLQEQGFKIDKTFTVANTTKSIGGAEIPREEIFIIASHQCD